MRTPTAVLDLEISGKFTELNDIGDFSGALVLFRLHGRPLGWGAAPVTDGRLDRAALVRQLLEQHAWSCALPLAEKAVHSGIAPRAIDVGSMLLSPPTGTSGGPLVTVAVCSRTPAAQLQPCLDSLIALNYAPLDLVLIDASDDRKRVEALVRDQYPAIRYSSAPGVGAAPRHAIDECRGDVLALTHGDTVVDRRWGLASGVGLPRRSGRDDRDRPHAAAIDRAADARRVAGRRAVLPRMVARRRGLEPGRRLDAERARTRRRQRRVLAAGTRRWRGPTHKCSSRRRSFAPASASSSPVLEDATRADGPRHPHGRSRCRPAADRRCHGRRQPRAECHLVGRDRRHRAHRASPGRREPVVDGRRHRPAADGGGPRRAAWRGRARLPCAASPRIWLATSSAVSASTAAVPMAQQRRSPPPRREGPPEGGPYEGGPDETAGAILPS